MNLSNNDLADNSLSTNSLSSNGLRTDGLRTDGLRTDGLRTDGLRTDGLRTDGLRTDGLPTDEIINFWFDFSNPKVDHTTMFDFWFDTTPDEMIRSKYKKYVDLINIDNYQNLIKKSSQYDKIALLIIGDQFSRNIYRNDNINRTKNDNWALELALDMISKDEDIQYNLNMRYFILLPLRHQKRSDLLDIVVERIKLYIKLYKLINPTNETISSSFETIPASLVKFYTHTLRNYTNLTDRINIIEPNNVFNHITYYDQITKSLSIYNKNDILDKDFVKLFGSDNLDQSIYIIDPKSLIYKTLYDWIRSIDIKRPNIGISLSGGVDSMVLLSTLVQIRYTNPELISEIVAIHIEHSNRIEAIYEREFLAEYCQMLGVKLYYRSVYYMTRNTEHIDRDIYENETKILRFGLYKYVVEKEGLIGVCMGHHMGDITENVFTNIIKGRSVGDLGVMKIADTQYDVNIYRPFLNLIKSNIFEYSHKYLIPYFKNSTPVWSCRGVLRDQIIPILQKQFGDFEPNIIKFMNNCNQMALLNNKYVLEPFYDSVKIFKYGAKIPFNPDLFLDVVFDNILIKIFHSMLYHMISNKSKHNYIRWLKTNKDFNNKQFDLNYACFSVVLNDNIYIIDLLHLSEIESFNYRYYETFDNLLDDIKSNTMHNISIPPKIKKISNPKPKI
jgi:tRNA(Ile)-lysidine synthetase-like protein